MDQFYPGSPVEVTWEQSSVLFRFGDAPVVPAVGRVEIPVCIGEVNCNIVAEVVDKIYHSC